ncbi:MAG TPA: hypothetical protein EYN34_00785 [Aquifex sp.]|nr:hypothetical protein [Aquifex sp.]
MGRRRLNPEGRFKSFILKNLAGRGGVHTLRTDLFLLLKLLLLVKGLRLLLSRLRGDMGEERPLREDFFNELKGVAVEMSKALSAGVFYRSLKGLYKLKRLSLAKVLILVETAYAAFKHLKDLKRGDISGGVYLRRVVSEALTAGLVIFGTSLGWSIGSKLATRWGWKPHILGIPLALLLSLSVELSIRKFFSDKV